MMRKIIFITTLLLSFISADIGLGIILEEGQGGFTFGSNLTYIPKKPSSGELLEDFRTINLCFMGWMWCNKFIDISNWTKRHRFK